MGKRIAVLAPFAADPDNEALRQMFKQIVITNLEKIKEDDTQIEFFLLNKGFTDPDFFPYYVFNIRNNQEFFEAALSLRDQGFDALVLHCASDPHLDPIRQVLDIPVVGVFQAGLLMSFMMGYRFGVVTFNDLVVPIFENIVQQYGLGAKAVRVRATNSTGEEMMGAFLDAHDTIEKFSSVARECIADGAEVLVPG
jgi:Asp/Glu/hydantoin racemase